MPIDEDAEEFARLLDELPTAETLYKGRVVEDITNLPIGRFHPQPRTRVQIRGLTQPPPPSGCRYSISFDFNIDSSEYVSGSFGGELFDSGTMFFQPYYDASVVTFYLNSFDSLDISTSGFFDVWHTFTLTITEKVDHSGWDSTADIDGAPFTGDGSLDRLAVCIDNIKFGSLFQDNFAHRSLRNIAISIANQTFNFTPDSFDSFVGGASIVGGTELRIDQPNFHDAYARKNFDRDMTLCCSRDCDEISSLTIAISASASSESDICGHWSGSYSATKTLTRVDHNVTPGTDQFQLYFRPAYFDSSKGTCCELIFNID